MTIFKEVREEEYVTTPEAKELLAEVENERAVAEDREMRYELARAIEHVNRFAVLDVEGSRELVEELRDIEKVDGATAYKVANLLPADRDELRSVFAQERYSLDGEELDEVLDVVAKYAETAGRG
ncbi:DNA-directed RNA polymerase subunit F [Halobacteriales archaeon QH_7_69_31]|nr:MAG: DNA-directed RNA polymerase subunit F [Halobacteriales archaeon QH_7_69_31]